MMGFDEELCNHNHNGEACPSMMEALRPSKEVMQDILDFLKIQLDKKNGGSYTAQFGLGLVGAVFINAPPSIQLAVVGLVKEMMALGIKMKPEDVRALKFEHKDAAVMTRQQMKDRAKKEFACLTPECAGFVLWYQDRVQWHCPVCDGEFGNGEAPVLK